MLYHDSPLYRLPFRQSQRLQLAGVPIGIARGALEHCAAAYKRRYAVPGQDTGDAGKAAFLRLARARIACDAAAGLVFGDARSLDSTDDGIEVSALDRARQLSNIAYAAQQCRRIVSDLFEQGGAGELLEQNQLQRIWRDSNAAAAHTAFVRDIVDLSFGRTLCGLDA